jgi:hypothetical protein
MTDTTPMAMEVNCTTGEVTERPLTAEEIAQHHLDAATAESRRAAEKLAAEEFAALKTSAKAKLVAGQPLTEQEAETIVL